MKPVQIAALAVFLATPAFAGSSPASTPPTPAAYDWTGPLVGANFGWDWSRNAYDGYESSTGLHVSSGTNAATPFHGGGLVGYNYMFPSRLVIGAAASLGWSASSSVTESVYTSKTTGVVGGAVLVKLGYAFGDWLPYVDGGWAWSSATTDRTQLSGGYGPRVHPYTDSVSFDRDGWDLGAGVAYHVWGGWEVYGQYDHKQFARVDLVFSKANVTSKSTLSENGLTFGVGYKF